MRKNVYLKSALRQPIRTPVLVLLIGLITFAFVSKVAEYLVVTRETDRLEGYYRSIGVLESITPDDRDVSRGAELVSKSRYVAFEDRRRYCSGVLQGIYNADVDGYFPNWSIRCDVVFYGKLIAKSHMPETNDRVEEYHFDFAVDNVVVGYPEYVQDGSQVRLEYWPDYKAGELRYIPKNPEEVARVYDSFEIGERYLVRGRFDRAYQDFYRHPQEDGPANILVIQPLTQNGVWFRKVEPGAFVDLSDPALAGLAEELAVIEENQHAMSVIGTVDMSAMPQTQEATGYLYLTDGRWLSREDHLEGRRVCVVHNDFAVRRGLSVGDTITLKLRDLKDPCCGILTVGDSGGYSTSSYVYTGYIGPGEDWHAWQSYETRTEEFEIVGLYGILSALPQPTLRTTEMYIPDSCMPAGYCSREQMYPEFYSFVLDSPRHEKAFLDENRQALEELGLRVRFVETGWKNFQAAADPMRVSFAINVRVFSAVLVVAMGLAAFLYLWQRRRDFAIMRSMGVPKYEAVRQLVWSMAAIGAVGVAAGGILSWRYALGKAASTLAALQGPKGQGPSADLSPVWLGGLCILAVVVLLSFTLAGASVMSRCPVLELLQGAESRAVRKRKLAADAENAHPEEAPPALSGTVQIGAEGAVARLVGPASATGHPGRILPSRYVFRHIRRAPLKSFLTVSVALGFTVALGWLNWSVEQNNAKLDNLYRSIPVEAQIVKVNPLLDTVSSGGGFIPPEKVDAVLETGFVKETFLVATSRAKNVGTFVNGKGPERDYERLVSDVPLLGFSRPERFFKEVGSNYKVEYAEGWDASLFGKDWVSNRTGRQPPVVLPLTLMRHLQLKPGDSIWLQNRDGYSTNCEVAGWYVGMGQDDGSQPPILLPFSVLKAFETGRLRYSIARFAIDPGKNRELAEFRAKVKQIFSPGDDKKQPPDVALIIWDEQLTQVVEPMEKNLMLTRILRSVTIATSALIAAGLGALMVFQKAKEAAIMRVLGVTKRTARFILCGEQGLLCLLGLALGLGSFAALRGEVSAAFTFPALGCAALYLAWCLAGAWLGARSVTDRPPLDLLQVKE